MQMQQMAESMKIRIDKPAHWLLALGAVLIIGSAILIHTVDPLAVLFGIGGARNSVRLADAGLVLGRFAVLAYILQWGVAGAKHLLKRTAHSAS